MSEIDVTDRVEFSWNDGEDLPITKCVCGAEFSPWGGFTIGVEKKYSEACPECGARFYFMLKTTVMQIT